MKIDKINHIFKKSLQPVLAALAGEVPEKIGDDKEDAKENTKWEGDETEPAHGKENLNHSPARTIWGEYAIYLATTEGPTEKRCHDHREKRSKREEGNQSIEDTPMAPSKIVRVTKVFHNSR